MERQRNSKGKMCCCKKPIKIWDANVENIVQKYISKLVKTKTNSRYLIRIKFDKAMMNGYVKTFEKKETKIKTINYSLSV